MEIATLRRSLALVLGAVLLLVGLAAEKHMGAEAFAPGPNGDTRAQSQDEALMRDQLGIMAPPLRHKGVKEVHLLGQDPYWQGRANLHRDGIHPSPAGVSVLARIIVADLDSRAER